MRFSRSDDDNPPLIKAPFLGDDKRRLPTMQAFKRFLFLSALGLAVLLGPFFFGYHFDTLREASISLVSDPKQTLTHLTSPLSNPSRGFHFLVPATDPNLNFCKLILSAAVTGYPEPVFIGWHGKGIYNGTESHLFKITETLTYLRQLPPAQDEDMVVILDAYDVWMQLRPDVLLKRYYSVLRKNDERLREDGILGKEWGGHVVKSSIVIGPDKIHWPQWDPSPAVWAVPNSTLDRWAFGPDTESNFITARPRWFNSGTLMGPVKDMRDFFAATVDMVSKMYDSSYEYRTSDQYYFAEVWGEQEVNRLRLKYGEDFTVPEGAELPKTGWSLPNSTIRTEYGITQDYETELFQTAAAYDMYLLWMRYNGSRADSFEDELRDEREFDDRGKSMDQWTLPEDVRVSPPPFSAATEELAKQAGWDEVMLGSNVVTETVFPLFHMTGDKSLRDRWWPRMWFHPHSEVLQKAAKRQQAKESDPTIFLTQDNVKWQTVRTDGLDNVLDIGEDEKGGAWTDGGEYVRWKDMCQPFEDELYLRQ